VSTWPPCDLITWGSVCPDWLVFGIFEYLWDVALGALVH
jgi:hypothetical protein